MAESWTKQQLQAMQTEECNLLVAAAAGSGKTAVLVKRIIRKITDKDNPIDIDRMVVVTFTNAAAAEMRQRIRNALDELIQQDPGNELLQRQITLVNNAHISTIDSFCLDLVRNYFANIDIDPSFRAADEDEIRLLEHDIMEDMIEEYYSEGRQEFYDLVDGYGLGRDDSALIDIITRIYKHARSYPWEDEWYEKCLSYYDIKTLDDFDDNPAVKYLWEDIKSKIEDYRAVYVKLLEVCDSSMGPEKYRNTICLDMNTMDQLLVAESFQQFVRLINGLTFEKIGTITAKDGVDPEKKDFVKGVRDEYKAYMTEQVKKKAIFQSVENYCEDMKQNYSSLKMMLSMARDFSKRMSQEKRNRNIIDFNDMEHMALDILVRRENGQCVCTEVAETLKGYYEEIMIDEYQDSNMLQEVILSAIARTEPYGNMYMVGDVKQSIYRFRLACPDLFISKYDVYDREYVQGITKNYLVELQNNFRSRKSVLDAANDVFARLMNPRYCKIDYNDDVKLNAGLTYPECGEEVLVNGKVCRAESFHKSPQVDVHLVPTENQDADNKDVEAVAIAEVIESMFKGDVRMVYDSRVEGCYRPIKYSDIVILGRAVKRGWAESIVNTLMNRGIPAYADAGDGYFDVREIQVMLSFLNVIDNPLQDIHMAASMLAYFGGFTAEELAIVRGTKENKKKRKNLYMQLADIANGNESDNGFAIPEGLRQKAQIYVDTINRYRDKSEIMSVRDLVWTIMYETGYYDYVGTMPASERRQANLDVLLEKVAAYESTSYSGLFDFLRYVERMQSYGGDMAEATVLGEQDNLVRVMTIHKSKGLEFPVVILSGMGKEINKKDANGEVLFDQDLGIGTSVVYLDKRIKRHTIQRIAIASKLVADSVSEEMRVLYVAMTRAREKLIVTGTIANEAVIDKWEKKGQTLELGGRFTYTDISRMTTWFDMFMPVAYMKPEYNNGIFNVQLHPVLLEERMQTDAEEDYALEYTAEQDEVSTDSEIAEAVEIPMYPYPIDSAKKAKVTVSELKAMQMDSDFSKKHMVAEGVNIHEDEESDEQEKSTVIPKFMRAKEEKLAGNERGTAYHRIMECLDYSQWQPGQESADDFEAGIAKQVEDMLADEKITKAQADVIAIGDIVAFCKSDMGKRVKNAWDNGKLWREQPFVFIDKDVDETQLIQGVIDLYLVDEDGIAIVDYKTDRVKPGDEGAKELVDRYKVQLDYYGKALSQLTGLPVKERVIYSFTLGREIGV